MNICIECQTETTNPKFCSRSCSARFTNKTHPKRKPEGMCKSCGNPTTTRLQYCYDCRPASRLGVEPSKPTLEESAEHPARRRSSSTYCTISYGTCQVCDVLFPNHDGQGKNKGRYKTCPTHRNYLKSHKQSARKTMRINSWLLGEWDGAQKCGKISKTISDYLRERANNICENPQCISSGKPIPAHPTDGASILEINHINGNGMDHRPENLEVICPTCHALTVNYRGRNIGNGRPTYYIRVSKGSPIL